MKNIPFLLLFGLAHLLCAQTVPTPAPAQGLPIILRNATLHLGNGQLIEKGDLLMENGKITAVGNVTQTFKQAEEIDLSGQHVYPGLIVLDSRLGIEELAGVPATLDRQETGEINPGARAIVSYNTDSRVIPTVRSNGVLIGQIAPIGGLFSGTSSVVQFDAWNWEDAVVKVDDALFISWPDYPSPSAPSSATSGEKPSEKLDKQLETLEKTLKAAQVYQKALDAGEAVPHNPALEAIVPALRKARKVYVRANTERQIVAAIAFKMRYDLDLVIAGGAEAYLQIDLLKQHKVPVVLSEAHRLPTHPHEDVDMPYQLPRLLHEAGIPYAFSSNNHYDARNLPFFAGTAAAYGLSKEEALMGITAYPARMLGLADRLGTLETGKDATLVVSSGDLLDMRSSQVTHAFIGGRRIDLGNKQTDLYHKFRRKYEK